MMPLRKKASPLTLILMVCITTLPLFAGIYFSDPDKNTLFQGVRQRKAGAGLGKTSRIMGDRVVLHRNQRLRVNDCILVFKGDRDGKIHIDLILPALDPESAYPRHIPNQKARAGFRMGDTQFYLVSVNKKTLKLRAGHIFRTE